MKPIVPLVAGVAALLVASACGSDPARSASITTTVRGARSTAPSAAAAEERGQALVRFVQAIPADASLDLFVDDGRAFENISYETVVPFREMTGQRSTFRLRPAGMRDAEALASHTEGLDDGGYYSVFAIPGADGNAAALLVTEDELSMPLEGKARVRVVHASNDAGRIDVVAGGSRELFDGVGFQAVTPYQEIDPFSGSIDIRADGETESMLNSSVQITAGKVYTIVVVGKVRASPRLDLFVIEDQIDLATP